MPRPSFVRLSAGLACGLLAVSLLASHAHAQADFPNKVIKVIVPVAPGGGADTVARMVTEKMAQSLGTTIIIDNKAGGSGSIAAMEVARAAPDGYTLMQCFVATHSTNPAVLKLKYDPILPDIQARLHEMAAEPTPLSPAQFDAFLKAEVVKWTKLVTDTHLQIEQ